MKRGPTAGASKGMARTEGRKRPMLINRDRKAKPYFVAQFTTPNTYLTNHTDDQSECRAKKGHQKE
jgi:hypothetical protein